MIDNLYKFEESFHLPNSRYAIKSEYGFSDISHSHKTIPYPIWHIETENFKIDVADKHNFFDKDNNPIQADKLNIGDLIMTENGFEAVISCYDTGELKNTYSPTVINNDSSYYANGIKNKNTTIVALFLVHFLLFNKNKTIAVLANKMQGAVEIVDRAKIIIENLPDFLKPGVKNYNKKTIELENGCKLIAAATSPSAVRGLAINCQESENVIEIRDKETGEVEQLSFEQLYRRLLIESSDFQEEITNLNKGVYNV